MMKRFAGFCLCLTVVLTLLMSAPAVTAQAPQAREVLTNESVIRLARARFKERTIIHLIRTSPTAFDISTTKLIELKRSGVSEKIISEMIERQTLAAGMQSAASLRDDEFFTADDEAFFNSGSSRLGPLNDKRAKNSEPKQSNETSIFGSNSGSQGRTRSRGLGHSGDQASQSEAAGTATVRIIRPPSEASEPKLERAPKLDNQAVIEMVQAGFSEGTVLRKIEITQVEFDLSAKALAELRRNRVSERLIKAMTEAMNEEKK
jgi:hypothetical protein